MNAAGAYAGTGRGGKRAAKACALAVLAILGLCLAAPLRAAEVPSVAAPFLPGGNAHAPISIDAAKLDYFDKEQKLVYSGGVTATQGDTTLKASSITVYLDTSGAAGATGPVPGANAQIRRMDVVGPVVVQQKDQVGMGDNASYERAENKIYLVGHVSLSQGSNIIKGDKLTYDLTTGDADVEGEHVTSLFTPAASGLGPSGADPAARPVAPKRSH